MVFLLNAKSNKLFFWYASSPSIPKKELKENHNPMGGTKKWNLTSMLKLNFKLTNLKHNGALKEHRKSSLGVKFNPALFLLISFVSNWLKRNTKHQPHGWNKKWDGFDAKTRFKPITSKQAGYWKKQIKSNFNMKFSPASLYQTGCLTWQTTVRLQLV